MSSISCGRTYKRQRTDSNTSEREYLHGKSVIFWDLQKSLINISFIFLFECFINIFLLPFVFFAYFVLHKLSFKCHKTTMAAVINHKSLFKKGLLKQYLLNGIQWSL